jgi:hypothetical protein
MSSNVKQINKQRKVFSIDEKMQILSEVDTNVGTRVDQAAMLSWLVSTLNTKVSKQSDIRKSYSCCGPLFSKKPKSLKTSPLEELETILSMWFKQACTANASIDGPHLKEKALNVAACLGINGFRASNGWIKHFKKRLNLVHKSMLGESAIVSPKTLMDYKSKELPKIIDRHQLKDILNVDVNGLFYNLRPSETMTYKDNSHHGGTKSKQRVIVLLGCNADGVETLPALVNGKYNKPHCFRNVKISPPNTQQIPIHG